MQILNQHHPLFQATIMFHGYLHNVDHQGTTNTFELQTGPENTIMSLLFLPNKFKDMVMNAATNKTPVAINNSSLILSKFTGT
jgi:hypothetical protein